MNKKDKGTNKKEKVAFTKDELLENANKRLRKMEDYCDKLEKQVDKVIDSKSHDDNKIKNLVLSQYNQQVSALISCTKMLITIDKSSIENEEVNEENQSQKQKRKQLVD